MAKRFTDTEKFNDPWYRKLSLLHKAIWEFLLAECNHAGIFEKLDLELMSFKIGADITMDDLKSFGDRIVFLNDQTIFIPKFIKFQYGELNPQSKVHSSVIKELKQWGIDTLSIEYPYSMDTLWIPYGYSIDTLSKPLAKSIDTLKDKDKDKEKEKEKNKEIGKGGVGEKPKSIDPDFYSSNESQKAFEIYNEKCENLIPLTGEKRNKRIMDKLYTYLQETDYNFEKFAELCEKANRVQQIAKSKIDFEMMLNCYIGILNGKYPEQAPSVNEQHTLAILDELKRKRGKT